MSESFYRKESPIQYKPSKSIVSTFTLPNIPLPEVDLKPNKYIEIFYEGKFPDIKFAKIYPKLSDYNNTNNNSKFKSFLCDLELFKWSYYQDHRQNLNNVRFGYKYKEYIYYLGNLLGNDISISVLKIFDRYLGDPINVDDYKNVIMNRPKEINTSQLYFEDKIRELKSNEQVVYYPIIIYNLKGIFSTFYSDEIKLQNTKWSIIVCKLSYEDEGHFTFIFVDHKERKIEFYDPHGKNVDAKFTEFIYESLSKIFVGYSINEFWKNIGIQIVEQVEKSERGGYCVIWGIMMIHLKLLNINTSLNVIERTFIKECEDRKLALYEIMINYAYFMNRIIPTNSFKFILLEKLNN